MNGFDPRPAAEALRAARQARAGVAPLDAAIAPRDEAEGYAAQHALARLHGAVPPAGFKIGATAKRMQDYLGLSGPAAGFMEAASLRPSGTVIDCARHVAPGVECEIAVRLAHDLPAGPTTQTAAEAAVGEVFAAIELVENRYADLRALGTPTLIADQVFHAAAILGPPLAGWRGVDLGAVQGRLTVNGALRDSGHGRDLLGHPMAALAWLAGSQAASVFGGLRAGQVVMLGSVTPPAWLDGPAEVTVSFDGFAPVTVTLR